MLKRYLSLRGAAEKHRYRGHQALEVAKLLKQNRCGQQPKWSQLGINFEPDPLHLKDVKALTSGRRQPLQPLVSVKPRHDSSIDEMASALEDLDLMQRWFRVKRWITVPQIGVPRGRAVEAELTEDEVRLMVDFGHCEGTSFEEVTSTCIIFPVAEVMKKRRRLIKHSKWFNATFGKETLESIHLLRTKELVQSVHDGKFAITVDFSAWFDQFEMAEGVRPYFFHGWRQMVPPHTSAYGHEASSRCRAHGD